METSAAEARGRLRVYLGAAAGVGTTYAMLDEAIRRRSRGAAVMVGCLQTHGRRFTRDRLEELTGARTAPEILDVQDVVGARPDVVLVDELAHRNEPGSPRVFRWQDVDVLLEAGIDVITTVSIQEIDSLADTVREIVGRVPETLVPDEFLRSTDQIEVVDISPAAIRRRIAHGNVFGPLEAQPAEVDVFSSDAFAQLRALMMFWMADRLSADAEDLRGAREKVVVAISESPTSDAVLRRAARLAHRSRATLIGVHVTTKYEPSTLDISRSARRERVERFGGTYHEVRGDDLATALVTFAAAEGATQLVIGKSPARHRWPFHGRPIATEVLRHSGSVDVHLVAVGGTASVSSPGRRSPMTPRQRVLGWAATVITLALLTVVLAATRDQLSVATSLAIYLLTVVGVTALGGPTLGLTAAVASPLLANWFLIPPYHTLRIANGENLLELMVFVSVAAIVSWYVTIAARRALDAQRADQEATLLASLTGSGSLQMPQVIVEQLRQAFGLDGVAVLGARDRSPEILASTGDAPRDASDADFTAPLASGYLVAAKGTTLTADDHRVLRAFLGELSRAFEQQRLREIAAEADALARADELRTAMLRAVSHDLRSPLATIKAAVSSLRQTDIEWPETIRNDFLASIEDETDRLTTIITNLLDLSRLEAGVLRPLLRPITLDEVVPGCLTTLGERAERVVLEFDDDLPEVDADPALLERVVANLVDNALRWSPDHDVVLRAHHRRSNDRAEVQLHVIDRGPGIPLHRRDSVLQPFDRLDDSETGGGLGLGLAIADRMIDAMGGRLELRDTPGGGLTAVVALPIGEL